MKNKKAKRARIGQHGSLTSEQARDKAVALLAQINAGGDPVADGMQKRSEPTVRDLADRYANQMRGKL